MPEPRRIPKKGLAGALLLMGSMIALVYMRTHSEPHRFQSDASAPAREAPTQEVTPPRPADGTAQSAVPSSAPSPTAVDLGPAMLEAKKLDEARAALQKGDAKAALAALDSYEKVVRGPGALRHEATMLRIETLAKVGRRSDAKALAMSVRDDPAWSDDQERIEGILGDAGLN